MENIDLEKSEWVKDHCFVSLTFETNPNKEKDAIRPEIEKHFGPTKEFRVQYICDVCKKSYNTTDGLINCLCIHCSHYYDYCNDTCIPKVCPFCKQ